MFLVPVRLSPSRGGRVLRSRVISLLSVCIDDLATRFAQLIALLGEASQHATASWLRTLAQFLEITSTGGTLGRCLRDCGGR
jgi:hypothetical protein